MFIKFGTEENIKKLFDDGLIYMNPKDYFRRIEDKGLRGDSYEGAHSIKNIGPGKFRIEGVEREFGFQSLHLPTYWKEVYGNIYSLTCIAQQTVPQPYQEFKLDDRLREFGSHCIIIPDVNEFVKRIREKLKFLNYKFYYDFVDYYDVKKINGNISPFHKPKEFEYQQEFRFYVERDGIDAIKFTIGSLHSIAHIYPTDVLISGLKLIPDFSVEPPVLI